MTNDMLMGLTALVLILGSAALWFRAAMAVRLPENRVYYVAAWVIGVVLAGFVLAESPGGLAGIAAGIALAGGAFLLLTVAISRQKLADNAIRPGDS